MRATLALGLLALFSPTAFSSAADDPADGFGLTPLPFKPPLTPGGPFGATVVGIVGTLSNGDVIVFDGQTITRQAEDGTLIATLGSLPALEFTGCFAIDPSETFAVIGESCFGDVFKVDLSGAGMTLLANLPFNFDAAFEDATHVIVTANTSMGFTDSDFVRVNTDTGATSFIGFVNSPSGPLVFDALGNLFYGLQSSPVDVVFWTAQQLAGGVFLDESNALTLSSGFLGAGSLAYDTAGLGLYLAENDFVTGVNRIVRVGPSAAQSPVVVEGTTPFHTIQNLEFVPSAGPALFFGYQPAEGGTLRYSTTDFSAFSDRLAVNPVRPTTALTGPGTTGPGEIDFTVAGGVAGGFFHVMLGPSAFYNPVETAYLLPGLPPLFSGLDPATTLIPVQLFPLDAAGQATISATNPGGLVGTLALQALVLDPLTQVVATSEAALL